jgi:hypothetical protein
MDNVLPYEMKDFENLDAVKEAMDDYRQRVEETGVPAIVTAFAKPSRGQRRFRGLDAWAKEQTKLVSQSEDDGGKDDSARLEDAMAAAATYRAKAYQAAA